MATAIALGIGATAAASPILNASFPRSIPPSWALAAPEGSSSAFVHLFEWPWADVAKECEQWLGPKGFTAVQVSPPNEHISGSAWWTRYQPVTYKLTSRSGDESAFADMVKRCRKVGVGIYADAVINHVAAGSGVGVAGSKYGNRATPIFSANDMHHNNGDTNSNCAVSNYFDKFNVQSCDLVGLPDLCTSCDYVQRTISDYLNHMGRIGIAGFRIDAAKHMDDGELSALLRRVNSSLWRFQEVISGNNEAVRVDMYYGSGAVTEFNYARELAPTFIDDDKLGYLGGFGERWGLMPRQNAVVFLDNHDTQRGEARLTYRNGKLYQLANIFMLAYPYGYPKVMSSYYFDNHDQGPPDSPAGCSGRSGPSAGTLAANVSAPAGGGWVCEHRWTAIANMVAWRRSAGSADVTNFAAPIRNAIAFCRGSTACLAINRDGSSSWHAQLKFPLPPGDYCNVIRSDDVASCSTVRVSAGGSVSVEVPPMDAVAIHIGKRKTMTEIFM